MEGLEWNKRKKVASQKSSDVRYMCGYPTVSIVTPLFSQYRDPSFFFVLVNTARWCAPPNLLLAKPESDWGLRDLGYPPVQVSRVKVSRSGLTRAGAAQIEPAGQFIQTRTRFRFPPAVPPEDSESNVD